MEAAGTTVQVIRADITRQSELAQALSTIRETGAPLKGIMHTAAVMDVALLRDLSPGQLQSVMAPKVEGTWKLHEATLQDKLDFFVLFSSAGAIHPQPGMGNYAAANAFLDAFAHYRRARGMVATSINWGIWGELGLTKAAAVSRSFDDSIDAYVMQGFRKFSAEEGLRMLAAAIRGNATQIVAVPFDWTRLAEFYGADQAPPLYADFTSRIATASKEHSQRSEIFDFLSEAESAERRNEIMEEYLQETLSLVLKLARGKIDRERPLGTMGLDSLMGLEFVRRLGKALEIAVPATVVFNYPTIRVLAPHLIQRLQLWSIEDRQQEETRNASSNTAFAALPLDLSEEDALEALIGEKGRRP
jgi:acyl carrier protein/nucleoside-diphosphate-sugar epimerase